MIASLVLKSQQQPPTHSIDSKTYSLYISIYRFGTFDSCIVMVEIECKVHVDLPKRPTNQFQPVWQIRQQALRAYCPTLYTVP